MDEILHTIAEPHRREILQMIWQRELTAGEIAAVFTISRPAISQHLKVLREAGLVSERPEGTKRFYRARLEKLAELKQFLEEFWRRGLVRVKVVEMEPEEVVPPETTDWCFFD